MKHFTLPRFWKCYRELPREIQLLADKNYGLLKSNPAHPSLSFKKIGSDKHVWSVRVGIRYRALGVERSDGIFWFWIGAHAEYDRLIS
ncbi:MAG: hypothetical protein ABIO91_04490 [Pyrinomonadaceae bacterium]